MTAGAACSGADLQGGSENLPLLRAAHAAREQIDAHDERYARAQLWGRSPRSSCRGAASRLARPDVAPRRRGGCGAAPDEDRLIRYGSAVYTYGAAGELKTKTDTSTGDVTTYDYDAMGNLRSVALPDGRAVSYVVDGNGRRVRKLVDGVAVQGFLYRDRLRVVAELDGQNNVVSRFVYADGEGSEEMAVANALTRLGIYTSRPTPGGRGRNLPAYMVRMSDNAVFRIIADHLGTPRLVVNVATGAVVQALAVDAWGVSTQDTSPGLQPFGFAGGIWDRDTGLVRFGARDYDAGVGRWTGRDPKRIRRRATNRYEYAGGDPMNRLDQSGELFECISENRADCAAQCERDGLNRSDGCLVQCIIMACLGSPPGPPPAGTPASAPPPGVNWKGTSGTCEEDPDNGGTCEPSPGPDGGTCSPDGSAPNNPDASGNNDASGSLGPAGYW